MRGPRGILLTLAVLSAGCAANSVEDPFAQSLRRWPDEPALARIELVGEFASAADLGISGGAWARFVGMAAGRSDGSMVRPMAVAVADDGDEVYVADPESGCVHRFDLSRNRYRCLAPRRRDGVAAAIGLAVDADGRLFAADSARGEIWTVESGGRYLEPFYVSSPLKQPTGVYWDDVGRHLYVTDTTRHQVMQFDQSGNLKRTIGENGDGPDELNFPTYVWLDANRELLVTDSLNFRIQRFSTSGAHIREFGAGGDLPGDFSRPKGVATDSLGHVYVVDALMHAIQIFDAYGRLLLAVGEQGQGLGQFWLPNGIFISGDDTIYVADAYNKRVQVFRYVGPSS